MHGGRPLGAPRRASPGRLLRRRARGRASGPASRRRGSRLHGNNKSTAEIEAALAHGVGRIVVDSFEEIDRIAAVAARLGVVAPVMVRVTVGVEAHTHEYIATAHEDQKFGFSLAGGQAAEAVRRILERADQMSTARAAQPHRQPDLRRRAASRSPRGGCSTCALQVAARARRRAARARPRWRLRHRLHHPARPADARGPGGRHGRRSSGAACRADGVSVPRISIEPGSRDRRPEHLHALRGGHRQGGPARRERLAHLRGRRRRDERQHPPRPVRRRLLLHRGQPGRATQPPALGRVVGKHCESGDIVVKDEFVPSDIAPGDLLAVPGTGAYCRSLSSQYNHVPRPPVVAVRDGRGAGHRAPRDDRGPARPGRRLTGPVGRPCAGSGDRGVRVRMAERREFSTWTAGRMTAGFPAPGRVEERA